LLWFLQQEDNLIFLLSA